MLKWNNVKEIMPGTNVKNILVYFGSSGNFRLCNYSTDEKCMFTGGHVFLKYIDGKRHNYVDYPTHWAF
ncbi:MAG: hypothetical protein EOL97_14470, partial [Spirochaetia bacterium]|nr:hypothetical protein [Spirochaetia bacterium]